MSESVIVVGINGSPSSATALHWAAAEAASRNARLPAIFVYSPPRIVDPLAPERLTEFESATRRQAREWVVDALGEDRAAAIDIEAIAGDPGPVLVEASNQADLLVLGVRGYGKYSYLSVPKIARFCLGRSRAPVVVVPAPALIEAVRSA